MPIDVLYLRPYAWQIGVRIACPSLWLGIKVARPIFFERIASYQALLEVILKGHSVGYVLIFGQIFEKQKKLAKRSITEQN